MSEAPPQGPLVDCHAHVWGAQMQWSPTAWARPSYVYAAEDFIADMDRCGIRYGVIAAASLFGTYSDYTLDALRRHKRLRATAIVDPAITLPDLRRLRDKGIVGIRLQWFMLDPLPDLAGADYRRLCGHLRDLDMHIHLNIEGQRLAGIARQLVETGVKLVIDHYGWHDFGPRLEADSYKAMLRLMEGGAVWVKLSSGFRRPDADLPADYVRDLLARFGPERLLWGSDAPFVGHEHATSYAREVAALHYAVPDEQTRQALGRSGYAFYFER